MFEVLKRQIKGPFYTVFTPFNADYQIDFSGLERYLTKLYEQGARRFYVMAYNSRYSQLSDAEIKSLNEFTIKHVKALNKDNMVIVADPIHGSTQNSLDFTLHAANMGADMVSLLFREKYFCDEQVLEHYGYIGEKSQFPILVHEMPFLSGADGTQMHWPVSLLERLVEVPQIAAIKEDAKDPEVTKKVLQLEPQIKTIIAGGGKATFRKFAKMGMTCWLNGISIIDARIAELFWQGIQENNDQLLDEIIDKLETPFFSGVVKKYGWHRTNKALLQAAGFMHRRDRMPLLHLNDDEFKDVQAVYQQISQSWLEIQDCYL